MEFLCSLWQHDNPEQTLLALDALCSCEEAIVAIVAEAQASVAAARANHAADRAAAIAATEDMLSRRVLPTIETACAATLTPHSSGGFAPFWAEVWGSLRLVRADYNLKSSEVCRLDAGALVRVHQVRRTLDGAWRGAVSLAGGGNKPLGWMTLVPKDGSENTSYVFPQPADDDDEQRNGEAVGTGEPTGGTGFLIF